MTGAALVAPLVAAGLGIGLVRRGWDGRRALALAGWALVLLAAAGLTVVAGAWGLATATTLAMVAALALLLAAAWRTPRGRAAPVRAVPAAALPRPGWRAIGARVAVFVLVVPVGAAASALLAFGVQAGARRLGWAEADVTITALVTQPVAWTILACVQMSRAGTAAMIAPAAACAVLGLLLWWPL